MREVKTLEDVHDSLSEEEKEELWRVVNVFQEYGEFLKTSLGEPSE